MKDYYKILEVREDASPETIQGAYRALSKKYHPDVCKGDKSTSETKFKIINEANEVLSDPSKRYEYDQFRNSDYLPTNNTWNQYETQSQAEKQSRVDEEEKKRSNGSVETKPKKEAQMNTNITGNQVMFWTIVAFAIFVLITLITDQF